MRSVAGLMSMESADRVLGCGGDAGLAGRVAGRMGSGITIGVNSIVGSFRARLVL